MMKHTLHQWWIDGVAVFCSFFISVIMLCYHVVGSSVWQNKTKMGNGKRKRSSIQNRASIVMTMVNDIIMIIS